MNTILRFEMLIPILLLVMQSFVLLFIGLFILRRLKLLKLPYAGMEYSQLIVTASILFGVFFISTADTGGLFQTFKTFQNANSKVFSNTFYKFSQFFLVVFFFEILFGLISFFIIKLLLGFKGTLKEIEEGNIPASVLMGVIIICFAIILQHSGREVIDYITPKYLNFK
jgi:hypothetical protein